MADKERVDSDYDGQPLRPLSKLRKDPSQDFEYDVIIVVLTDGTELVDWGGGEYYHLGSDGGPDFSRPVDAKVVEEDGKKMEEMKKRKSGGDSTNR